MIVGCRALALVGLRVVLSFAILAIDCAARGLGILFAALNLAPTD